MGLVIEKTAKVLELVSKREPSSLQELTEDSGMKKPTLFLILKSMVKVGFLEKNAENMYSLGPKLFELTEARLENRKLREAAEEAASILNIACGENVIISGISKLNYQVLCSMDSTRTVTISNTVLSEKSFYRNATGRVLLAHAPETLREEIIEYKGLPSLLEWPGVNSKESLNKELELIRGMDFLEKINNDAVFIACPVHGPAKKTYAIGINIPAYRYNDENREEVIGHLLETKKIMTERLSE